MCVNRPSFLLVTTRITSWQHVQISYGSLDSRRCGYFDSPRKDTTRSSLVKNLWFATAHFDARTDQENGTILGVYLELIAHGKAEKKKRLPVCERGVQVTLFFTRGLPRNELGGSKEALRAHLRHVLLGQRFESRPESKRHCASSFWRQATVFRRMNHALPRRFRR